MIERCHSVPAAMIAALSVASCAGGPSPPKLPPAVGPSSLVKLEAVSLVAEPQSFSASSAEIYSRIAKGAMLCWFGAGGRLRDAYVFQASTTPAADGGGAEIVVHERAVNQPKPWGYRAYRIVLNETSGVTGGANTRIEIENLRMPDAMAQQMRHEVFRWASQNYSCSEAPIPAASSATATAPQNRSAAPSGPLQVKR
ncbi:MAG: hypothetical protein AB7O43_09485 [Hyphomicrobiaceae bacterium]